MELGLTWPLQRLLHRNVPYGEELLRGFCWDAHCITLHGRSSLLLVHCESRYTCVRFDMSAFDWQRLAEIAAEEIRLGLLDAGIEEHAAKAYCAAAGNVFLTRTHGRREVAFLNRAWEAVLAADIAVEQAAQRQKLLNRIVNSAPCRCAGEEELLSAETHLLRYFEKNRF